MQFPYVLKERFSDPGRSTGHNDRRGGVEHHEARTGRGAMARRRMSFWSVNRTKRKIMSNNIPPREVIVSGIHLDLTPSLKTFVQEKAERLFRHEERIVRLRVELEHDAGQTPERRFHAKGHVQSYGPEMNAMVSADECHKAIMLLIDKLNRMLRRRARFHKARRHERGTVKLAHAPLLKTA